MSARDVFGADADHWARYRATLQVRDRICGGIPKDPDMMRQWLEARIKGGNDAAVAELYAETLAAVGTEAPFSEAVDALLPQVQGGTTFKRNEAGACCYEGRLMKAALKEAANVVYPGGAFPGQRAGSRKGLRNTMAETVFVEEDLISLGVEVPTTEQMVAHPNTPRGKVSTIKVFDVVERPKIECHIIVLDDWMPAKLWARVWGHLEENGLGANRAMGFGRFDLLGFDKVDA